MIFDSLQLHELVKAYENQPDFMVPEIVFLARSEKLDAERRCLEELFSTAAEMKQKEWLGRLLSADHEQFRSVWFEIMLLGWLKNIGRVEIEPIIEENYPDYATEVAGQKIIIEARAILETMAEREQTRFEAGIFWALKQIAKPYLIEIVDARPSAFPDWNDFQQQVINWLDTRPDEKFVYESETSVIVLKKSTVKAANQKYLSAFMNPGMFKMITSEPIRSPLREKAHQHTRIRKANYPYVIALFLEPWELSAEEVVRAWLGEEVWRVDFNKQEVVETHIDKSGIHFWGSEIRHTTVSGTLVFKGTWLEAEKSTFLRAWYIENPFAKVPIDPMIFPTESRYIVSDRSTTGFRMTWQNNTNI